MDSRFASLKAALFDLDGTLVRTFIDFAAMRAAMRALSARYGTGDATSGETDTLAIVAGMVTALPKKEGIAARAEAFAALEAIEEAGCATPEPVAGASTLLHRLCDERRLAIGVITRNSRRISEGLLRNMDLPHDVLIAREDVHEFKPHPAPILHACARLGVSPEDAVMVGDMWSDIASAKAAGVCVTIGIQWEYDPPNRFALCPPDIEVSSLTALIPLFLT